MNFTTPLYNLNPLNRFSQKANNYTKYRPNYPDTVIDKVLENLNLANLTVADIGAGTGIATRQLATRGINVIAIEPNLEMRAVAISSPNIVWKDGSAENTNLPDTSIDVITCFQAFHWFKPEPTLSEFRRILKPKGRIGIVFQDLNRDDEFTQEYWQIISRAANNRPPSYLNTKIAPLRESSDFQYLESAQFNCKQELDLTSLIGLAKSVSFISSEEKIHNQLVDDLKELYQRFCNQDGLVYIAYQNGVHLAALHLDKEREKG